jgi:NAD(P)H-hydrate epimerase
MKQLLDHEGSGRLDMATRELLAIEAPCLMEKASIRLWDALVLHLSGTKALAGTMKHRPLTALCGKGDNAGDALAMVRHAFSDGWTDLAAILPSDTPGGLAARQARSLESAGIRCILWSDNEQGAAFSRLRKGGIILDGILGTGSRGEAAREARKMIETLNALRQGDSHPLTVSVDIPSGLNDAWTKGMPMVEADLTLCLDPVKLACFIPEARPSCGTLVTVSGVFPERLISKAGSAQLLEEKDLGSFLIPVPSFGFKSSRGRLAVYAGSRTGAGAAMMAAKASLASGAGYVTLHVDEDLYPLIAPALESVIVRACRGMPEKGSVDAILAGPGWGRDEARLSLLESLLDSDVPLVLDADGIRLFAQLLSRGWKGRPGAAPFALTPHPGELQALEEAAGLPELRAGASGFRDRLRVLADRCGALIIAKSHVSWIILPDASGISGPERIAVWDGNRPELGTAGSGDVLAGLFAGLVAKHGGNDAGTRRKTGTANAATGWGGMADAARASIIAHAAAGRLLSTAEGWFEASVLATEASRLLHETGQVAHP